MQNVILIRIGEIFLKGRNKNFFINTLYKNIFLKISKYNVDLKSLNNRFFIEKYPVELEEKIIDDLKKVIGIHSISPCTMINSNYSDICDYVNSIKICTDTFRVTVNRADKRFQIKSDTFAAELGGIILKNQPDLKVDLMKAQTEVFVDIREKFTFVYYKTITCESGMPVSSGGNGLLLLSGGIDSPVAGYLMAKRGMKIFALHFNSYPYTNEQAKNKVKELCKLLSCYTMQIDLYCVSVTKIQEAIHTKCNGEYMITLLRRFMVKIAELLANKINCKALITGESLGQVASQTIESITTTNNAVEHMPVLRPLIAMDKDEIIKISKKIDTFKISILPYEDCCTVFLPRNPIIKPKIEKVLFEENKLDLENLLNNAMETIEKFSFNEY